MNRVAFLTRSIFFAVALGGCGASPDAAGETVSDDAEVQEETPSTPGDDTGSATPKEDGGAIEDTSSPTPGEDASPIADTATTPTKDSGAVADTAKPAAETGPAAPTFTELYTTLFHNGSFASNCSGSTCHDPGKQKALDFSTKEKGYTTIKTKLVVGNPTSSKVVQLLAAGTMPKGRPKWSTANVDKVRAWIAAGAKND